MHTGCCTHHLVIWYGSNFALKRICLRQTVYLIRYYFPEKTMKKSFRTLFVRFLSGAIATGGILVLLSKSHDLENLLQHSFLMAAIGNYLFARYALMGR